MIDSDIVLLIENLDNENVAPYFPIARGKTDNQGNYIFSDLIAEVGTNFLLGVLVNEERISSNLITYQDSDINYIFNLPLSINDKIESIIVTIKGQLKGNFNDPLLSNEVGLEILSIKENGQINSRIFDLVLLNETNNYIFENISVDSKTAFKLFINYDSIPIYSNLFFPKESNLIENLNIPFYSNEYNKLNISRQTMVLTLIDGYLKVSNFIFLINNSTEILNDLLNNISIKLPKSAKNIESPLFNSKQIINKDNNIAITGPILPGETMLLLEYNLPFFWPIKKNILPLFPQVENSELIYKKDELKVRDNQYLEVARNIKIGDDEGLIARRLNLTNISSDSNVRVTVSTGLINELYFYFIGLLLALPLFIYLLIKLSKTKKYKTIND